MSSTQLAQAFTALGHPKRIEIFEHLLRCANTGLHFGELQNQTGLPPSTLTHHIREMERGGVLIRRMEGRTTNLTLNLNSLQQALNHLISQCCSAGSERSQ